MPRLKNRAPRMCLDRGRHYVKLDGKRHFLGSDPANAREAYDRLIAEWLSNGRKMPATTDEPDVITVRRVCIDYWRHVKRRYQPGKASTIRQAIKTVRSLYGSTPANKFGPRKLRIIRDRFIAKKWARTYVNEQVRWVCAMFRWASSHEMVSVSVYRQLKTIEPLRKGEALKEGRKVKPVPRADIVRVRRLLPHPVRGLVNLQLLTAARPGELVNIRPTDIDMDSGDVWTYRPADHKTAHHDHERVIYFGPRAQRLLRLFIGTGRPLDAPIFSPSESVKAAKRKGAQGARRANQPPSPRRTDRVVRDAYDVASYRRAIHRVCDTAGVDKWSPHRLRHNAGTAIRNEFGLEIAQLILGHKHAAITEHYAELNEKRAVEIIRKIG